MYYIYILRCIDNSLYTGITCHIDRRYQQHLLGQGAKYTKSHPPVKIESLWICQNKRQALRLEYYLKKLKKNNKEQLILNEKYRKIFLENKINQEDYQRVEMKTMDLLKGIRVLNHSSIRIERSIIIYIDPYDLKEMKHDADYIFITHDHFDHYSPEDIVKVKKDDTVIVVPKTLDDKAHELFKDENIVLVEPRVMYKMEGIYFYTVSAYNVNKDFHPEKNQWVGYVLTLDDHQYYIAGDTDENENNIDVCCDVAFLPVGGTYTFNVEEAAHFAQIIKPQVVVPTHYGSVVGDKDDGKRFCQLLEGRIKCVCLLDLE